MTELELKSLNYRNGGNNYIQRANLANRWVAFSKSVIEKLRTQYGDDFNIIIYWNTQDDIVDYICVPMSVVSHLFTEEHLSDTTTGSAIWNFTIFDNLLCVHANKNYSVDISKYINVSIIRFDVDSSNTSLINYWIIPSNSNKFDIAGALEKFGFVDWKQKNNFQRGDIVYIYSTKPDQCVRYIFCVTDVDLTFDQSQSDIEFWNDQDEFYLGKEHNRYCRFVLNGELEQGTLDLDNLISKGLKGAPQSAMSVSEELREYIENYFKPQMKRITFVDEAESVVEFTEGSTSLVTRSSRQRNKNARQKCIELMGAVCTVCGFDFEQHYGSIGKGFIHVHHKTPISKREGNYRIDISSDLVPVCPNCHAMLHKEIDGKYLSVEELAKTVKL